MSKIFTFVSIKIMKIPGLIKDNGVRNTAFLVHYTACLIEVHLKIQGEKQLVQSYRHNNTFHTSLCFWKTQSIVTQFIL
jgi:hypothetical protein